MERIILVNFIVAFKNGAWMHLPTCANLQAATAYAESHYGDTVLMVYPEAEHDPDYGR